MASTFNFDIFPNPAGDTFFVRLPNARRHTVRLLDTQGKILWAKQTADSPVTIAMKNLPAGTYRIGVDGGWKLGMKQ
ncbi:MAG: T9SS type A sorting domain-containing protein [Saprospiraceae bacterium]|nr:T9SS type A sorting domain-containing protein [Saprospiraceae bacterium]